MTKKEINVSTFPDRFSRRKTCVTTHVVNCRRIISHSMILTRSNCFDLGPSRSTVHLTGITVRLGSRLNNLMEFLKRLTEFRNRPTAYQVKLHSVAFSTVSTAEFPARHLNTIRNMSMRPQTTIWYVNQIIESL